MHVLAVTIGFVAVIYGVSAIPYCPGDNWTNFYDRDNPSGNGDYETLLNLRKENPGKICAKPLAIHVTLVNGDPFYAGGNYIRPQYNSPSYGFACVNADQSKHYRPKCKDYRVRFCCLPEEPKCPGYWTPYYDRDDPSATGDWEDLNSVRKSYPAVCKHPVKAWAQLVDGSHYLSAGNNVHLSNNGFYCKNSEQPKGTKCHDYKVKFCCVFKTPSCSGKWTNYFDRDDPSATGDWETLKDIRKKHPSVCAHPINVQGALLDGRPYQAAYENVEISKEKGLVCKNENQKDKMCQDYKVRFCCPKVCYWTSWFDVDNPSGKGDYETLENIRKKGYKVCKYPKQIVAVDKYTHVDANLSGRKIYKYDTTTGFVCRNGDQKPYTYCLDYKVKFYCCD